ncbi:ribosome biogenesis protein tsr1 [Gurleya vavrai]
MKINENDKNIYNTADGPYKTISFVKLSSVLSIESILQENFTNSNLFYSKKTKTNLMFINTEFYNDLDLSFAIRSSDIVVFLFERSKLDESKISFIKKHLPSFIFCVVNQQDKLFARKFAKKNFGIDKVVSLDMLENAIGNIKIQNSRVAESRPFMIPQNINYDNGYFFVTGYSKKAFVTNKLIMNGTEEFLIESVLCDGKEINASDVFYDKFNIEEKKFKANEEIDLDSDHENENFEESEDKSEKYEKENIEENEFDNCIEKYKNYKGIRNLKTCNYVTKEYPEYYNEIIFLENFSSMEFKVKKLQGLIKNYQMITLKLTRKTFNLDLQNTKFCVFYNVYEFEDKKSIYNVEFITDKEINSYEDLIVDYGHKIEKVNVLLTNASNSNVYKIKNKLNDGVMTFIASINFNIQKILIFDHSYNSKNMIGKAHKVIYKDRVILEEVRIEGQPKNIDKRYCTIHKMFNFKDEVLYFRNLQLMCKDGNTGIIKKAIGTHGIVKAYFNKPVTHGTAVYISLYKRIFPKYIN